MREHLKILFLVLGMALLCLLITGCGKENNDSFLENNDLQTEEITRYVIMEGEDGDKYKIYYYGINNAIIIVGENSYDFEQTILTGTLTLDEILNDMELYATLNDGGTKIYKGMKNGSYLTDGYSLIRCNTIDGNRDIYIGKYDMEYEDFFCKFKTTDAEIKLQEEVDKMNSTKMIVIKNTTNNKIINKITDETKIKDIIEMIAHSTESTLLVTSEGSNLVIQMFDEDNKLITFINVWESGYFGFKYDKEYYISKEDIDIFNNIIKND